MLLYNIFKSHNALWSRNSYSHFMAEELQPTGLPPASITEVVHIRNGIWIQVWVLGPCLWPSWPLSNICVQERLWLTWMTWWRNTHRAVFSIWSILWMERKCQCAKGQMELLFSTPSLKKPLGFPALTFNLHYGSCYMLKKRSLLWPSLKKGEELNDSEGTWASGWLLGPLLRISPWGLKGWGKNGNGILLVTVW